MALTEEEKLRKAQERQAYLANLQAQAKQLGLQGQDPGTILAAAAQNVPPTLQNATPVLQQATPAIQQPVTGPDLLKWQALKKPSGTTPTTTEDPTRGLSWSDMDKAAQARTTLDDETSPPEDGMGQPSVSESTTQ